MDKDIKANITMLRTCIKNSNIVNNKMVGSGDETSLQLQFDVGLPQEFEISNELVLQAGLRVRVNLLVPNTNEKITEISAEINGDFKLEAEDKETALNMLKYNAVPLLYQEMRTYITSLTALAHNKVIYLPMINFVNFFNNNKDNK